MEQDAIWDASWSESMKRWRSVKPLNGHLKGVTSYDVFEND
jgi:hypothetical protein